ncbi:MAG: hypothetical protein A7316_09065 [Candidatus Altiarchaeales archaeon WOR_SM1_86-2]|nr:MAG: hypothetical protein A7316_09065 [Candidatus Altiarchaeales archaeon WOR_SM1_86-2]ODS40320.1 MAG: hypothetical protein A7315_08915 [Candidatus Altiarchaeales archaeon WOR_SM1_79]
MYVFGIILLISFIVTFITTPFFIKKLKLAGITGSDMSKADKPKVAEMGGIAIVTGFITAVLAAIAMSKFLGLGELTGLNVLYIFAGLSTILIISIIGIFDDLITVRQSFKALLPAFAALPLMAANAGVSEMAVPFYGSVDFGILYPLLLIPIGITVASNVTNMMAGFNGLEAGMGAVMTGTIAVIAVFLGEIDAAVISLAMLGGLLAFLYYNWYPARIFPGDIGTLSIGAVIATSVIIGNIETVGAILMAMYAVDVLLKANGGFPKEVYSIKVDENNKLRCPEVVGVPSLIMRLANGITERKLVLLLIGVEIIIAAVAISTVLWF